jgi:hypothetical protein
MKATSVNPKITELKLQATAQRNPNHTTYTDFLAFRPYDATAYFTRLKANGLACTPLAWHIRKQSRRHLKWITEDGASK